MTTNQVNVQQIMAQAVVGVMAVGIFASAIGIMVAAAGVEAIPAGVVGTKATRKGIATLREAFGGLVVDRAVKDVGTDDIVILATRVEELVRAGMVGEYGEWATTTALASAPPGDLRAANEIARVLSQQGATPATPTEKVEQLAETGVKKARAKAKPVVDTKTKIEYKSESAAGRAVAAEYGYDPDDHFVWYKILKEDPERFRKI